MTTPTTLDTHAVARSLRLAVIEGCLFALMVGLCETYVTANGIALGASAGQLALLIAVPLLVGGAGPALVLAALRAGASRRSLCTLLSVAQATTVLAMAHANWQQTLDVTTLIALFTIYQMCGQGSGTAWSSWYGDLVPAERRGAYFAGRSRLIHLTTFLGLLGGGLTLQALEPGALGRGFALAFAAAGACRLVSAALLWRSPEPRAASTLRPRAFGVFLQTRRGRTAGVLLLGSAAFQAATYYSSPFFAPYMLHVLKLSYLEYTLAVGTLAACKFAFMPWWGRVVDRRGPKLAYGLGILLAAMSPLAWQWIDSVPGVLMAQAFSGFAWGGYEVALFTVLLHCSRRSARPHLFAAQTLGNSLGQCSGSLVGGSRLEHDPYLAVFAVGTVLRASVGVTMVVILAGRPGLFRRRIAVFLRVLGYRPGLGVVHRPIEEPSGERKAPPPE
jgi:MFS family permease